MSEKACLYISWILPASHPPPPPIKWGMGKQILSSSVINNQLFPTIQLAEKTCWRQLTSEVQLQVVLNSMKTKAPTVLQSHSLHLQVQFYYITKE